MEEDGPFLPWIVECALKFFSVIYKPEPALSIGMVECGAFGRSDYSI